MSFSTLFGFILIIYSVSAQATPITGARFVTSLSNEVTTNHFYRVADKDITNPSAVDDNYNRDFEVVIGTYIDEGGNEAHITDTMTLSGAGKAGATSNGVLKTYTTATVINPLSSVIDNPFVTDTDFNVNESGVPQGYSIQSVATFEDTVQVTADESIDSIQLVFGIDGNIIDSGINSYHGSQILLGQDIRGQYALGAFSYPYSSNSPGNIDTTVLSGLISLTGGEALISYGLYAEAYFFIEGLIADTAATLDFFNTLTIQDVRGFNSTGQEVFITSVTGSDGAQIIALRQEEIDNGTIPTPATILLISIGLAGLIFTTRMKDHKSG